jgi:uncharacterized membrane protein
MIVGHNLLDGIHGEAFGDYRVVWALLHEPFVDRISPHFFVGVYYPLMPWIGVMAAGYTFGRLLEQERESRDRRLRRLGWIMIGAFVALRFGNVYGDPTTWQPHPRGVAFSVLAALNVTKYPPSLQYLLMTLGPALLLMPWLDRCRGVWADRVAVFGRVPFFYYMLHLPLIHLAAVLWTSTSFGVLALDSSAQAAFPAGYMPSLMRGYAVWIITVLALYPLCRRYADYKRAHKGNRWLSYL